MRRLTLLLEPYRGTFCTMLLCTLALYFITLGFAIIVLYDCEFQSNNITYSWLALASRCLLVVLTVFYAAETTDVQLRLLPLAQSTKFWLATLITPAVFLAFTLLTPLAEGLWQIIFQVCRCSTVSIQVGGYLQFLTQHWPLLTFALLCGWATQLVTSLLRVQALGLLLCVYVCGFGLSFELHLNAVTPAFGCFCIVASAAVLYGIYQVMRHWQIKNNGLWMI